jgi:4-amino-4-deoxychorismate lyase
MYQLVESIRLENGVFINIGFHNERMSKTLFELFGLKVEINLMGIVTVPDYAVTGVFKCRVIYDNEIRKAEFIRYSMKSVRSLKIIEDNSISYSYKFTDRTSLEKLLESKNECDDILIVKNGYITDTSSANVILKDPSGVWHTPSTFLLPGTRRASLLAEHKIRETTIRLRDIGNYTEVRPINAMIGMDDSEGISVKNIK